MRKGWIVAFLIFALVGMSACGVETNKLVKKNMAEVTSVYYYGESEDCYATLSVGEREEEYLLDGSCGQLTEFALLVLAFHNTVQQNAIKAKVLIDNVGVEVELELNANNGKFMCDLERKLTGEEVVAIEFDEKHFALDAISNDFLIDSNKAIEIACQEFEGLIQSITKSNKLLGEGYLRILDKKANNFDGVFWCFTLLDRSGNSWSVIISTEDGSILAKSI